MQIQCLLTIMRYIPSSILSQMELYFDVSNVNLSSRELLESSLNKIACTHPICTWTWEMLNHVFQDQRGICHNLLLWHSTLVLGHSFFPPLKIFYLFILDRPHDRVPLKDMKADWHACLDNKLGFKVK